MKFLHCYHVKAFIPLSVDDITTYGLLDALRNVVMKERGYDRLKKAQISAPLQWG